MSTHTFSVETLTPIATNQPEAPSFQGNRHYLYDSDNHEICFLNQDLLQSRLDAAGVDAAFFREGAKGSLRAFLKERVHLTDLDIEEIVQHRRPANGYRLNTIDHIQPGAEIEGAPALLASQLTEAIQAATLYDWLKSEKETGGKEQLEKWVQGIESCYEACKGFFQELKVLQDTYRRNPRRLGKHSVDRMHNLQHQLQEQLESNLQLTDSVLFGEKGAEQIQVTTSPTFDNSNWEIQAIGKINIDSGDLEDIGLHEAVAKGASAKFELKVDGKLKHPHLAKWNEELGEEVLAILYNHAYDLIEFEREFIDELIQENKYGEGDFSLRRNQQENLENLRNHYDNLLEEELEEAGEDTAFLRLNRDGSYMARTYALALFQQDEEAYNRFQILYNMLPGQELVTATHTDAIVKLGQKRGRRQDANILSLSGWVKIRG